VELPAKGLDADSDHVIRFAGQTGLNCLPDQPLIFRVQLNRHTLSSLDYLSFPAALRPRFQTMIKYEVIIYWSDEDGAFLAEVPELPGCVACGDTYGAALGNAQDAIRLWIDTAKEFGDPIPEPKGRRPVLAWWASRKQGSNRSAVCRGPCDPLRGAR
jgi:predicted RNase H-like HicB family nuclease